MNRRFWYAIAILLLLFVVRGRISTADNHQTTLIRAIEQAESVGAYSYRTDLIQTTRPLPKLINLGLTSTEERFEVAGSVNLPEEELHLTLTDVGGVIEIQVDEDGAFGRLDPAADWQPLDDFDGGLFAPGQDSLAYLHAAENVTFISSDSRAGLSYDRYTFDLNGETFAAHVRALMEEEMHRSGELPSGLRLQSSDIYAQMEGQGELWIGANGLPIRQIINGTFPASNTEQVSIELATEFFGWDAERVAATQPFWEPLRLSNQQVIEQATFGVIGLAVLAAGMFTLMSLSYRQRYRVFAIVIIGTMVFSPVLQIAEAAEIRDYLERIQPEEEPLPSFEPVAEPFDSNRNLLANLPDLRDVTLFSAEITSPLTLFTDGDDADSIIVQQIDRAAGDQDGDLIPDDQESPGCQNKQDCDGDGLTDLEERIGIGTRDNARDTDGDGLSDSAEVRGFNGKYTNALAADTNEDGLPDGVECSETNGQLSCPDSDGDGTADVFDYDDDGDGVPDKVDISVNMVGDVIKGTAGKQMHLSINGLQNKLTTVELQIRPNNPRHLWHSRTILDWPEGDTQGNVIQVNALTLGNSGSQANGDTRAVPMLEISIPYRADSYGNLPTLASAPANKPPVPTFPTPKADRAFDYEGFQVLCYKNGYRMGADDKAKVQACIDNIFTEKASVATVKAWDDRFGAEYVKWLAQCHLNGSTGADECKNIALNSWLAGWLDKETLAGYGVAVRPIDDRGNLIAYLPLQLIYDKFDNPVAFAGTMPYLPTSTNWGNAHDVRLVWSIDVITERQEQTITRTCANIDNPDSTTTRVDQDCPYGTYQSKIETKDGDYVPTVRDANGNAAASTVISYDDDWQLTGLSVREDHGFEAALIVENPNARVNGATRSTLDNTNAYFENDLWRLANGLSDTFMQGKDGFGFADVRTRWNNGSSASAEDRWNFPADYFFVEHGDAYKYPTQIAGMNDLTKHKASAMLDAHIGARIDRPVILTLYEERFRQFNGDALTAKPGETLAINAADVLFSDAPDTRRGLKLSPYEQPGRSWQAVSFDTYYDHLSVRLDTGLRHSIFNDDTIEWSDDQVREGGVQLGLMTFVGGYGGLHAMVGFGGKAVDSAPGNINAKIGVSINASKTSIAATANTVAEILDVDGKQIYAKPNSGGVGSSVPRRPRSGYVTGLAKNTKGTLKLRTLNALKSTDLDKVANKGGALAGVAIIGVAVVGTIVFGGKKTAFFHVSNVSLQTVNAVTGAFGVIDAGKDLLQTAKTLKAGAALKAIKGISKSAKVAAVVGLVLDVGVAVGTFIATLATGAGNIGAAIANLAAAIIVAALLFAIALIPVVGQIIVAVLAFIDALIMGICALIDAVADNAATGDPNSAGAWVCKGIAGALAAGLAKAFYEETTDIDMNDANRLAVGNFKTAFGQPNNGLVAGNILRLSIDVSNTPKLDDVDDGEKPVRDAFFKYDFSLFEQDEDYYNWHCGLSNQIFFHDGRNCVSAKWQPTGDREKPLSAEFLNLPLPEWQLPVGLNHSRAIYLNESSLVHGTTRVIGIPIPDIFRESKSLNLTGDFYYDVFPPTLDGFFSYRQDMLTVDGAEYSADAYRLAWDGSELVDLTPSVPIKFLTGIQFPFLLDADGDGLRAGVDPDDNNPDKDGDGLNDFYEIENGSNPNSADSDSDGLTDLQEMRLGTDLNSADSDNDRLTDKEEVEGWLYQYNVDGDMTLVTSNPWTADTDGDAIDDFEEKAIGLHPRLWSTREYFKYDSEITNDDDGFVAPGQLVRYVATFTSNILNRNVNAAFEIETPDEMTGLVAPRGFVLKPSAPVQTIEGSVTVKSADQVQSGPVELLTRGVGSLAVDVNQNAYPYAAEYFNHEWPNYTRNVECFGGSGYCVSRNGVLQRNKLTDIKWSVGEGRLKQQGPRAFTMKLWTKPDAPASGSSVVLFGTTDVAPTSNTTESWLVSGGFALFQYDDKLYLGTRDKADADRWERKEISGHTMTDGHWHYISVMIDWGSAVLRVYIDGRPATEIALINYADLNGRQPGHINILRFKGSIDTLAAFDREVTAEQIAAPAIDFGFEEIAPVVGTCPYTFDDSAYRNRLPGALEPSVDGYGFVAVAGSSCNGGKVLPTLAKHASEQISAELVGLDKNQATISLYVNPAQSNATFDIFKSNHFYFGLANGRPKIGDQTWNTTLAPNQWQHIVVRVDGATAKLWKDGSVVGEVSNIKQTFLDPEYGLDVFGNAQPGTRFDELRVYPYGLNDGEVTDLFTNRDALYLPLDEPTGATQFATGGQPATCQAGSCPVAGAEGQVRNAVRFAEEGQQIQVPAAFTPEAVSFWIRPSYDRDDQPLLKMGTSELTIRARPGTTQTMFLRCNGSPVALMTADEWIHITLVGNQIYVNGARVGPASDTCMGAAPFTVGDFRPSGKLSAYVDELRFSDVVLTEADVRELYTGSIALYEQEVIHELTIDDDNPTITPLFDVDSWYTTRNDVILGAEIADATSGVTKFEYRWLGNASINWRTAEADPNAPGVYLFAMTQNGFRNVFDRTIEMRATDAVGHQTTVTRRVKMDGQDPYTSTIDEFTQSAENYTTQPDGTTYVNLSGVLDDDGGVGVAELRVTLSKDGETVGTAPTLNTTQNTDGKWNATIVLDEPLNGSYRVDALLTDAVGNQENVTRDIVLDSQPPRGAILSTADQLTSSGTAPDLTLPTISGIVADVPYPNNARLHFPFEEATANPTTFTDISATGRGGSCTSCPTIVEAGKVGKGASFASGQAIVWNQPDNERFSAEDFAFTVWINPTAVNDARLFEFGKDGTNTAHLSIASGKLRFTIGTDQIEGGTLTAGTWQHVAIVQNNGIVFLYINGAEIATGNATHILNDVLDKNAQLWVGKSPFGSAGYVGQMDDVQVFDRALLADEIAQLVNPTSSGISKLELGFLHIRDDDTPSAARYFPLNLTATSEAFATWTGQIPAGLEGHYRVGVRATDGRGNVGNWQPTWQGTIDTTAPRLYAITDVATSGTDQVGRMIATDFNLTTKNAVNICTGDWTRSNFAEAWYAQFFKKDGKVIGRLYQLRSAACAVTGALNTARACDSFDNCASTAPRRYPGEVSATWGSFGFGDGQFHLIEGLAVDPSGNIYASDRPLGRIQKFDAAGNYLTQWKTPQAPKSLTFDSTGHLIVVGRFGTLYRYTTEGELLASVKLPPPNAHTSVSVRDAAVLPDGTLAVALGIYDKNTSQWAFFIHRYSLELRDLGRIVASPDRSILNIDVDSEGNIFARISDRWIQKFDTSGQLVKEWDVVGTTYSDLLIDDGDVLNLNTKEGIYRYSVDGDLLSTTLLTSNGGEGHLAATATGELFISADRSISHITPKAVQPLPAKPTFISALPKANSDFQLKIKYDSAGNFLGWSYAYEYFPDQTRATYQTLTKYSADGSVLWKVGTLADGGQYLGDRLRGFDVDSNDNVYVPVVQEVSGGQTQTSIQVIDKDGKFVKKWDGAGKLNSPYGIAIDGSDNVYIMQQGRIHKFDKDGNFIKTIDNATVRGLRAVSYTGFDVDAAGNIYAMGDTTDDRVVKLDKDGNLLSADFIPSLPAEFDGKPRSAMEVDDAGRVYVIVRSHHKFFQYATDGTLRVSAGDKPTNPRDPTKPDGTFKEALAFSVQSDGSHVLIYSDEERLLLFKMGTPSSREATTLPVERFTATVPVAPLAAPVVNVNVRSLVEAGVANPVQLFASADQPIKTLNITIDGDEIYTQSLAATDNITNFVDLIDWIPTGDGDKLFTATVIDHDDNSATFTETVRVDGLPPEVTLDENVFNDGGAELGIIELSGFVTDTIGLRDFAVEVIETGVMSPTRWTLEQLLLTDLDDEIGLQRSSWAGFWDVPESAEEIEYTAIVTVTDLVGRETTLTETLYVDIVAPTAPPTVTLTTNGVALAAGDLIDDDTAPTFDLAWGASDSPDIASYEIYWQKLDADGNEIDFYFNELGADSPLVDSWSAVDGETISVTVTALDYAANRSDAYFGTVTVDHATTPVHYGVRNQSAFWLQNSCNAIGQDYRYFDAASVLDPVSYPQRFYTSWDANGLHIGWTGADWSEDGDLWLYLDTVDGGSDRAYDPYATTQGNTIVRLPVSADDAMLADYAIWVHEHEETITQTFTITNVDGTVETITETVVAHTGAALLRWDGSGWLVVSESSDDPTWTYQFNDNGLEPYTGFYLPFGDIGIADPVDASLKLLAFATEPDALHLWATAPATNLLNSPELVDGNATGELQVFALLQNYAWASLGADTCPSGDGGAGRTVGLPAGAQNLSAEISSSADGIGYALNGDNLSGFQADLLANLLDWNTLENDLCSTNPDSPECRRELNAPDYHFADGNALAYLVGADHALAGSGDTVTYSIRLRNRSTVPLSGVQLALAAVGPVQLSTSDIDAGTLQPDEVRIVTFEGTINTSISDDDWATVNVRVLHATSTGEVEVEQLFYDIAVDQNAPSYVEVSNLRSTIGLGEQIVEGIVVDQSAVPQITVRVEINDIDAIDFTCTDDTPEDGAWTCPVTVNAQDNDTVRLTVRATDQFGQTSDWFEGLPLIADATPPVLSVDLQDGALLGVDDLGIAGVHSDFDNAGYVEACLTVNGQETCDDVPFTEPKAELITTVSDSANAAIGACGGGELTRTFDVADELFVARAELQLSIDHPFRNDLLIKLTSPTGTEVTLVEHGAGANGLNVLLTDAAVLSVGYGDDSADHNLNATPNLRQPSPDALAAFIGENSRGDDGDNGIWTLSICDSYPSEDMGTYLGGELRLTRDDDQLLTDDAWAYNIDASTFTEMVTATLAFVGVDGVGNRSAAQTFDVTIDVVAPVVPELEIKLTDPDRAIPTVHTHADTRISAAIDDDTIMSAVLEATTPNGTRITRPMTLTNGVWVYDDLMTIDGQPQGDIFNSPGIYEVDVLATDSAGNAGRSEVHEIEVIGRPDLTVSTRLLNAGVIQSGGRVLLEVVIANSGEYTSTGFTITHTPPEGTKLVGSTLGATTQGLAPGAGITGTVTLRVDVAMDNPVTLTHKVAVDVVNLELVEDNNSAETTFTINGEATAIQLARQATTTWLTLWLLPMLFAMLTLLAWRRYLKRTDVQ